MNKTELIASVAEKAELTKKDAEKAVNALFTSIEEALVLEDKVQIIGFGTFEVKEVAAKTGINPRTNEKVAIAACKKPVMKFGKAYKEMINN